MMGKRLSQFFRLLQHRSFGEMSSPHRDLVSVCAGRPLGPKGLIFAIACTGVLLLSGCQVIHTEPTPSITQPLAADPIELSPLPPITLGLEAPDRTQDLGRELLIVGHSDRLLDREVGDRVQNYWPLRELLLGFNREFRLAEPPLGLALAACPELSTESRLQPVFHSSEQPLVVCYDLLQRMDDYADDLSGSLTEQHLAVLDMFYFTVARALSRLVLSASDSPEKSIELGIKPLGPRALAAFDGLSPETALDRLTTQLPQRLKLQQQTVILSGTQWLFNQGHPLLSPEKLKNWTGQLMDESNYQALICTAQNIHPKQFPFLRRELPAEFDPASCP